MLKEFQELKKFKEFEGQARWWNGAKRNWIFNSKMSSDHYITLSNDLNFFRVKGWEDYE